MFGNVAAQQLLGWRVFPLPLTNTDALALPTISAPSNPAASPEGPPEGPPVPAPAAAAATASLGAPTAADSQAQAEVMASFRSQMSWAAQQGEHPIYFTRGRARLIGQ